MKIVIKSLYLLVIGALVLLNSCGSESATTDPAVNEIEEEAKVNPKDKVRFQRAKIVFFSLPSPMETSRILKMSGAVYNKGYLNNVDNRNNYQTSRLKAVGLGIFVADLSFANAFDQQQDCLDYFVAVRELSEQLALSNVFTADFIEKIEANIENEDSVLKYLSDSYWQANNDLKEDGRESYAALIAAGAWIEGLHIATSLITPGVENQEFLNRIAEQKASLSQLINYMDSFKDPKNLKDMTDDMMVLKELFKKLKVHTEKQERVVDEDGVATVGSKKVYTFPDGLLEQIIEKSHEIRNKYA